MGHCAYSVLVQKKRAKAGYSAFFGVGPAPYWTLDRLEARVHKVFMTFLLLHVNAKFVDICPFFVYEYFIQHAYGNFVDLCLLCWFYILHENSYQGYPMAHIFIRFLGLVCLVSLILGGVFYFDILGSQDSTSSTVGSVKQQREAAQQDNPTNDDASVLPPLPPPSMPISPKDSELQGDAAKAAAMGVITSPHAPPPSADTGLLRPSEQQGLLPELQEDSATSTLDPALAPAPQIVPSNEQVSELGVASSGDTADATAKEAADSEDTIKGTINKGDTVGKLLSEVADNNVVQGYINATRRVFPLTSFRAGQPYVLVYDTNNGSVKRFEYEIDTKRRLVVEGEQQPMARVEAIEYDTHLAHLQARIDANLFQSVADIGESPNLAITMANLFGSEINFIRDLQEGDSFSVLVEKLYREGKFRGYGRVLGATFTNKGKTFEAFLFHNGVSSTQHFNAKGENLKKVLLQSPLSFTRLTSRFTHSRKHPILGVNRPHLGVDYGAPTGTPVKAVGEGTVILRGWVGGYGNQVVLRHAAGLESMYSHLSGFARGLKKGTKVRQGQVIAYVGSTGQSTGPHLDFRLKQNSKFIDPTKAVNPRSASVSSRYSAAFAQRKNMIREYLDGTRSLSEYDPSMVVSPAASEKVEAKPEKAEESPKPRKRRR